MMTIYQIDMNNTSVQAWGAVLAYLARQALALPICQDKQRS